MDNFGTLLAHNVWQSIIIFGVVFAILRLIKNTSAEEKSWSWSATLFALALLPLAAFLPGKGLEIERVSTPVVVSFEEAEVTPFIPSENAPAKIKPKFTKAVPSTDTWLTIDKNDLLSAFMVIWSIGTGAALLRLFYAGHNASRLRSSAYPYAELEDQSWPRDVEIAVSDQINGPIVIGVLKPLILIPRNFAYDMEKDELKPLLYHELAHIKRRDNLLHFVERLIIAFYWWNPVMHYIAARIAEERELACDDRAASSCGDNLIYAKSLLKGARKLMGDNKPILGLAVLRRESVLSKRVKRLTVASAFQGLDVKRLIKNLSALSMAIILLCLITPRIAIGQDTIDKKELNSVEMNKDGLFLEVEWKGNIVLDDQDAEITELSDDGYFSLTTEADGERKELILSHDGEAIDSRFLANGAQREMTTEDLAWQRYALVDMLRLSGINAEKRVDRLYEEGGAGEVIDEIAMLHSDYATRLYAESLVDIYELEQEEIKRLISMVGEIDSDYEKGLALASIADEQELENETAELLESLAPDTDEDFHALVEFEQITEQEQEEIRLEIERQLAELPTEEEIEQIRQEALDSLPTIEELEEMHLEALESMPSAEEIAEMRAEALASVPTVEEIAEIREEALAEIPSEEELAAMVQEAMEGVPTVEELEEMVADAQAFAPSVEELMAIREEALAGIPTAEELKQITIEALASVPTVEEIEQMRKDVIEGVPDIDELRRMQEDALESLPTQEELEKMRNDIRENILSKEEIERIRNELREQLKNLPDREELQDSAMEISLVAEDLARIKQEIARSLSEIHIEQTKPIEVQ